MSKPDAGITNPDQILKDRALAVAKRTGALEETVTKTEGQVQEHINISEVTSAWDSCCGTLSSPPPLLAQSLTRVRTCFFLQLVHHTLHAPLREDISEDDRQSVESARSSLIAMFQSDSEMMGVIEQMFLKLTAPAAGSRGCLLPEAEPFLLSLLRKPVTQEENLVHGALPAEARNTGVPDDDVVKE